MPDPRVCPIADVLELIGEKWSLLAVREVMYGVRRFDGIVRNTGAPRDVLATRLRKLVAAGILEKRRYSERPPRDEYWLTQAGKDLSPVLMVLKNWGDKHLPDAPHVVFEHTCGHEFVAEVHCEACGEKLRGRDLTRIEPEAVA
jgi:DNA-binding HxlR family transcriptional regulator